jgi:hydrogenase maturation protein HypF
MHTWHIHIEGQVQGVGFRPFVYRLALEFQLNGWVNNTTDGVHIEINAGREQAQAFCQAVLEQAPDLSRITAHRLEEIPHETFTSFKIIHSQAGEKINLLLTPDFALCAQCRADLYEPGNRRGGYPFTTCTYCGPRYSIIRQLPYDRPTTTMAPFPMCPDCQAEYDDPLDRRYFAQTNSCPNCSIPLRLYDAQQSLLSDTFEDIIPLVLQAWKNGQIVAIKGIGGYLLCCDASHNLAVDLLRKRKRRPSKPFALMYPNEKLLAKETKLHTVALHDLRSPASPIVLLSPTEEARLAEGIAPGLSQLGIMLPYAPIFEWLLKEYQKPIVATSGNPTESPIVYEDAKALQELTKLADLILSNERKIVIPQDDSLIRYTPFYKKRIILRRSRGLAPTYINAPLERPDYGVLATGAMLKSTFTFLHQKNIYISQYLGDLANFDTEASYKHTIQHFFRLFDTRPAYILADKHPEYPSTRLAEALAEELTVPLEFVQHHIAHFAALLGEQLLIHSEEPVLGVIWDGTGWGEDRQIWGGEFFIYHQYHFQRAAHFEYFNFMLGDKMPKEPRISALSAAWKVDGVKPYLREKFSKVEWNIYANLLNKGSQLQTSSMGRIFDAVSSLLGLMDKQTYEGEAAMQLEELALRFFQENGWTDFTSYFQEDVLPSISTHHLMKKIGDDLEQGETKEFIAAKFHYSLTDLIKKMARHLNIQKIAFSGGVFQNALLNDLILHYLKEEFELFFHQQLSPNDENVSFGQMIFYQINKYKG